MIEMIVWGCIAHCMVIKPVATMFVFDDVKSVQDMCNIKETSLILIACTKWSSPDWHDTFIYIPQSYLKVKPKNDLCNRSMLQHEIVRATYHDNTFMLGRCSN